MVYIIDKTSLTKEEIEKIENSNLDYAFIGIDESVNLNKGNPSKYIYVSRNIENITIPFDKGFITPIVVRITDNEIWSEEEGIVDAKVKNVDQLINENFITLLGEKVCFSEDENNEKCSYFYIKRPFAYSLNKKIWITTIETYSLGRYFPKEKRKTNLEIYSEKILKCKKAKKIDKEFYKKLLNNFLGKLPIEYDYCWYVPVKSTQLNRFELINSDNGIEILEDYNSIKKSGLSERYSIVKEKYDVISHFDVNNKIIILVDDIITTGATLETITRKLYEKGAKKVIWITFAKTISLENLEKLNYICSNCKEPLCVRFKNNDGSKLFVCPNCNKFYSLNFHNLDKIYKN